VDKSLDNPQWDLIVENRINGMFRLCRWGQCTWEGRSARFPMAVHQAIQQIDARAAGIGDTSPEPRFAVCLG